MGKAMEETDRSAILTAELGDSVWVMSGGSSVGSAEGS